MACGAYPGSEHLWTILRVQICPATHGPTAPRAYVVRVQAGAATATRPVTVAR